MLDGKTLCSEKYLKGKSAVFLDKIDEAVSAKTLLSEGAKFFPFQVHCFTRLVIYWAWTTSERRFLESISSRKWQVSHLVQRRILL